MCGRHYRIEDKQVIAEYFHAKASDDLLAVVPDCNIAPSTTQPIIRLFRETATREIVPMRWDLISHNSNRPDPNPGIGTISYSYDLTSNLATESLTPPSEATMPALSSVQAGPLGPPSYQLGKMGCTRCSNMIWTDAGTAGGPARDRASPNAPAARTSTGTVWI